MKFETKNHINQNNQINHSSDNQHTSLTIKNKKTKKS